MNDGMTFLLVSAACAVVGVLVIDRPKATIPVIGWLISALFGRRCCRGCSCCREQ